jgi:RND superfamily putative drug exporter
MIATGLAIGVLIDAVTVRTLLVPALVAIMGRWNWWMPHRFARILRVTPTTALEDPVRAGACGASGDALGITR